MLHDGWSSKWKAQRINTASYCDLETCRSVLTRTKALSTLMHFRKRVLFETFSHELGVSCYQTRSVWKRSPEWILSPFSCCSGRRKRLCSSKTLTTRPFLFFFSLNWWNVKELVQSMRKCCSDRKWRPKSFVSPLNLPSRSYNNCRSAAHDCVTFLCFIQL